MHVCMYDYHTHAHTHARGERLRRGKKGEQLSRVRVFVRVRVLTGATAGEHGVVLEDLRQRVRAQPNAELLRHRDADVDQI